MNKSLRKGRLVAMKYDAPIYRPPSEAYSLIIQVTLGCTYNKCTFCSAFQSKTFRVRSMDDIKADLKEAREIYPSVEKIFLADGDSLILPTSYLLEILIYIRELFPECQRIGTYGSPRAINLKTVDELKKLKKNGLGIVYMGLESGNDEVLRFVNKGVNSLEMVTAGRKIKESGIPLSITVISGLGGRARIKEHAIDTARVLNQIDPEYVGLLTLILVEGTVMYIQRQSGEFSVLTPKEIMMETKLMLQELDLTDCVFRANHASNYLPLKGTLPKDKPMLIEMLNKALTSSDDVFKSEEYRFL